MEARKDKEKYMDKLTEDEKALDKTKDLKRNDYLDKTVEFQCKVCGLEEMCHYYGNKPKFTKNLVEFKEDAYVMVDPFSAQERRFGTNFLQLGGNCAHCKISVCVECSIFYSRRFCLTCSLFYCNEFPSEVQTRINKLAATREKEASKNKDKE